VVFGVTRIDAWLFAKLRGNTDLLAKLANGEDDIYNMQVPELRKVSYPFVVFSERGAVEDMALGPTWMGTSAEYILEVYDDGEDFSINCEPIMVIIKDMMIPDGEGFQEVSSGLLFSVERLISSGHEVNNEEEGLQYMHAWQRYSITVEPSV
jgi:hypothetical protein